MRASESIGKLCEALSKAQGDGDRFAEARAIYALSRQWRGKFKGGGPGNRKLYDRFIEKVAFGMCDCWFWTGTLHKLGYGLMNVDGIVQKAHRVSWTIHNGAIPDGLMVLHRCDVRSCVNHNHLFLGTQTDNMQDMMAKGRGVTNPRFGEQNKQSKLTASQVTEMRRLRSEFGTPYWKLAEMFGVVTMTAQRACVGTSWSKTGCSDEN